jgi:methyl-accepting chemotaxis protein
MFRIGGSEYTIAMTDVYYRIILGSIEGDAFEEKFSSIPMIIGSMFVTIFLINVLIAYLSNLFSRLEEQQKFQEMQEKAELILDIEIIVRFFKYYITGHISVRREYESEFYKRMLRDANIKGNISFEDKKKNKVLKNILESEKYLYILKKIELTDNDNSENVYQKVKSVNKSIVTLNSNISKKFRMTDSVMEKIFHLLKKNSNSQEKTVDELKSLMAKNSQNVYENTEALKIQSDEHDKELNRVKGRVELLDQKVDQILNILKKIQG